MVLEAPDLLLDNRMSHGLALMPNLRQLRLKWLHVRDLPEADRAVHLERDSNKHPATFVSCYALLPQVHHLALHNVPVRNVRWEVRACVWEVFINSERQDKVRATAHARIHTHTYTHTCLHMRTVWKAGRCKI